MKKQNNREVSHLSDEKLVSRLDLPEDQWIHLPKGVSTFDFFRMSEEEAEITKKRGWEECQEHLKQIKEKKERNKR